MSSLVGDQEASSAPLFWYGLPHGFQPLDLAPSSERIAEIERTLAQLEEEAGQQAQKVLRFHLGVMQALRGQGVQSAALGVHPDGSGGMSLSVLAASSSPSPAVNPKAVLVSMLDTAPTGAEVRPLDLPAGPAFYMETVQERRASGYPADEEGPHTRGKVWEGSVVVPDTKSSSVLTLQLSTASVEAAQDYAQILIAIAHSVSFTDPEANKEKASEAPPERYSIAQEIMDDFG